MNQPTPITPETAVLQARRDRARHDPDLSVRREQERLQAAVLDMLKAETAGAGE